MSLCLCVCLCVCVSVCVRVCARNETQTVLKIKEKALGNILCTVIDGAPAVLNDFAIIRVKLQVICTAIGGLSSLPLHASADI